MANRYQQSIFSAHLLQVYRCNSNHYKSVDEISLPSGAISQSVATSGARGLFTSVASLRRAVLHLHNPIVLVGNDNLFSSLAFTGALAAANYHRRWTWNATGRHRQNCLQSSHSWQSDDAGRRVGLCACIVLARLHPEEARLFRFGVSLGDREKVRRARAFIAILGARELSLSSEAFPDDRNLKPLLLLQPLFRSAGDCFAGATVAGGALIVDADAGFSCFFWKNPNPNMELFPMAAAVPAGGAVWPTATTLGMLLGGRVDLPLTRSKSQSCWWKQRRFRKLVLLLDRLCRLAAFQMTKKTVIWTTGRG
ncbi:hypothetical protein BV898_03633 [Hypsibius exemplaris]|uniref:Uncharacterized protein n=1 Tax=Hypsibius exemplaris TaxID=2072580 RepID=A0A1W0X521_HYPEX|nr:hypothetical protein BV898_03633 [Hypsibius exemplaris]